MGLEFKTLIPPGISELHGDFDSPPPSRRESDTTRRGSIQGLARIALKASCSKLTRRALDPIYMVWEAILWAAWGASASEGVLTCMCDTGWKRSSVLQNACQATDPHRTAQEAFSGAQRVQHNELLEDRQRASGLISHGNRT